MQPVGVESDEDLDLRHYLDVIWRRKLVIILAAVVVTVVSVGLSVRQPDQYRASSQVLLQGSDSEQRLGVADDPAYAAFNRVETEIGVIQSDLVREAVADELGYQPGVSVSAVGDTDLVRISATSPTPAVAAEVANTYAEVYVQWRRDRTINDLLAAQQTVQAELDRLQAQIAALEAPLEPLETSLLSAGSDEREGIQAQIAAVEEQIDTERNALQSQIALYRQELSSVQVSQQITRTGGAQIVSNASVPTSPFAPTPLRNGILGLLVGAMFGVGLAFLFETLDDRIRSKEQLEAVTGWPTLGLIPVNDRAKDGKHDLVSVEAPTSPAAESYRTLRTAVQFMGIESPLRMIQVTSPKSGDGKTTTASNLAVTLARAGNRVVLIDADLRRPRIHDEFDIPNDQGFTSILLGDASAKDTFHRVGIDNLVVMPAGPPPPNPSELLALHRTKELFARLREECDVLIVDSPPLLPVTDPLILAGYADGVLVVTDAASARVREVRRSAELLNQVNANVLGLVVNRVRTDTGYGYSYGYAYGGAYGPRESASRPPLSNDRATDPADEPISSTS